MMKYICLLAAFAMGAAADNNDRYPGQYGPGFPMTRAIRMCQDSVANRLTRDGYRYVVFERTIPDNGPGRHDRVLGTATAKRGFRDNRFSFSCSVDFRAGRVRAVTVHRR
jgi:hypothetical protein